jgi:hypothetical protein
LVLPVARDHAAHWSTQLEANCPAKLNRPHTLVVEVARCVSGDCLASAAIWREPSIGRRRQGTLRIERRDVMNRLITALLAAAVLMGPVSFAAAYENDNDYSTRNAAAFYWRADEARGGGN